MSTEVRPLEILLLGSESTSSSAIYHRLKEKLPQHSLRVVFEKPQARKDLVRGRMRRLGAVKTLGQLAFIAYANAAVLPGGKRRREEIAREHQLNLAPIPESDVTRVESVNSPACRDILANDQPRVVVLSGTRIVGKATLKACDATFINMHAGVTPRYRGVHGGYWALAEGRPDLVGTTIHYVDEGIDTGRVIAQRFFTPSARDDFGTYPLLHIAHGMPALIDAVRDTLDGKKHTQPGVAHPSRLRYHPTIWEYAAASLLRGVR